jgi:hypothetical protein
VVVLHKGVLKMKSYYQIKSDMLQWILENNVFCWTEEELKVLSFKQLANIVDDVQVQIILNKYGKVE